MSLTLTPSIRPLVKQRTHRWAKCWEIRPNGLQPIRLTDCDRTIRFAGFDYVPTGSGSLSAQRRVAELEESNADFAGALTSDAITDEDLLAGRYREAEVNQFLVDHRFPSEGAYETKRFWITETKWDSGAWSAAWTGIPSWLRMSTGFVHGRTCDRTLYDVGCGVSKGAYAMVGATCEVTSVLTSRLKFTFNSAEGINSQSNGYYDGGELVWYSGANEGVTSQIKTYIMTPNPDSIELELRTPLDIQEGDTFNAWAGCNKLGRTGDCKDKFDNLINFRGYQDMPGTDRMVQSPTQ